MTSNHQEGQTFAQRYSLDRKIPDLSSGGVEAWVVTRKETGDRLVLKILPESINEADWQGLKNRIESLQGLLHENITLVSDFSREDEGPERDVRFLAEPYISGGQPFNPTADNNWPVLSQLLETLIYAHNLGIPHGNLHPANLIVDTSGKLHLTGFGLGTPLSRDTEELDYLSPQVREGAIPDLSDDVYSLGCILFQTLTGKRWSPGVELDAPLPPAVHGMIKRMLSATAVDRQISLAEIQASLRAEFEEKTEGITSVSFSRPGAQDTQAEPLPAAPIRQGNALPLQTVLLAGAGLAIFGLLLFLLLPKEATVNGSASQPMVEASGPERQITPQTPLTAVPTLTPREKAALEFMEQEGERIAREILRRQLELEDLGVTLWAAERYNELTANLDTADSLYREKSFEAALASYEQVLDQLQNLINGSTAVLSEQISIGDEALEVGDANTALTAFSIATAIEPGNADLQRKLDRAVNLEEVLYLVQQAEATERNGDLDGAAQLFKQARDLDSLWGPAEEGYRSVREAITLRRFRAAMSEGFQAIAAKDYDAARTGFNNAQSILPNSSEPADGLLQIEQAERNDLIQGHRKQAAMHESASDWPAAIKEYEAALAITPNLEFALTGLAEAKRRQELDQNILRFLRDPTLLQSDDNLDEASRLLRDASRLSGVTGELQQQINTLAQMVSTARIEIPVTITSDGKTDVTVRRHKALGTITSEIVYLIPGRWAIVGIRPGYQDVRRDLVLIAGRPVPEINIASTDRVR